VILEPIDHRFQYGAESLARSGYKRSYRIETATATIGVRGTILDYIVSENKTLVTLQDGQASVCTGKSARNCWSAGTPQIITIIKFRDSPTTEEGGRNPYFVSGQPLSFAVENALLIVAAP
jgi:hypothetical protein